MNESKEQSFGLKEYHSVIEHDIADRKPLQPKTIREWAGENTRLVYEIDKEIEESPKVAKARLLMLYYVYMNIRQECDLLRATLYANADAFLELESQVLQLPPEVADQMLKLLNNLDTFQETKQKGTEKNKEIAQYTRNVFRNAARDYLKKNPGKSLTQVASYLINNWLPTVVESERDKLRKGGELSLAYVERILSKLYDSEAM